MGGHLTICSNPMKFITAKLEFRAYQNPVDASAGAHSDANNIRQVCRVIDRRSDDFTGIVTLQCRDTWFKDKELSKN